MTSLVGSVLGEPGGQLANVGKHPHGVRHGNGDRVGLRQEELADGTAVLFRKAAPHVVEGAGGKAQRALRCLRAQVVGNEQRGTRQHNANGKAGARYDRRHQVAGGDSPREQQQQNKHSQRQHAVHDLGEVLGYPEPHTVSSPPL